MSRMINAKKTDENSVYRLRRTIVSEIEERMQKLANISKDMDFKITLTILTPNTRSKHSRKYEKSFVKMKRFLFGGEESEGSASKIPALVPGLSTLPLVEAPPGFEFEGSMLDTPILTPTIADADLMNVSYSSDISENLNCTLDASQEDEMIELVPVPDQTEEQEEPAAEEEQDNLDNMIIEEDDDEEEELDDVLQQEEFLLKLQEVYDSIKDGFPIVVPKSLREAASKIDILSLADVPNIGPPRTWKNIAAKPFGRILLQLFSINVGRYFQLGAKVFAKNYNTAVMSLFLHNIDVLIIAMNTGYTNLKLDSKDEVSWLRKNSLFIADSFTPKKPRVEKPLTPSEISEVEDVMKKMKEQEKENYARSNNLKKALVAMGMPGRQHYLRVYRNLLKSNYRFERFGKAKPELSDKAKEKRLNFCRWLLEKESTTPNFHRMLLHTDEMSLSLRDTSFGRNFGYWTNGSEEQPPARHLLEFSQKFAKKIMVACCISHNLKLSLRVFVEPQANGKLKSVTENGDGYCKTCIDPWHRELEEAGCIKDNGDGTSELVGRVYCQDGAPSHTSRSTLQHIDNRFSLQNVITGVAAGAETGKVFREKRMHEWPPHSPDLNPLDYSCWANFKYHIRLELGRRGLLYFSSLEHAKCVIEKVWKEQITQENINNMVAKLVDKARIVVELGGSTTEGYKGNKGSFSARKHHL